MLPYDALTDEEKLTISYYLAVVGGSNSAPLDQVLSVWNKNKIKLFKALGNKLRVSIPVTLPRDMKSLNRELSFIYLPYTIWYETDRTAIKDNKDIIKQHSNNEFIADVLYFWVNQNYCLTDLSILSRLFRHDNISKGYISSLTNDDAYHFKDFKCTVKNGMKTIRTLQKVLQATHYPNLNLFEDWKNSINKLSATQDIHTNLVISISPLDFMTMSDNACNWSSCMSWSKNGCYRAGTLEMMNSNLTVVAYLEGPTEYKLDISETERILIDEYLNCIKMYGIENVMLLSPYKEHECGVNALNAKIQKILKPDNVKDKIFRFHNGEKYYRIGDPILNLVNDKNLDITNGDIGFVVNITKNSDGDDALVVKFQTGEVYFTKENLNTITLAYACTVHKSQGSEFKAVLMPAHKNFAFLSKRNLVYTGISRGKTEVVVVGQREALNKSILTEDKSRRITSLGSHLKLIFGEFVDASFTA